MELFIFKKPYPYQQDIIDKTIEFKGNTLIQLPTGGGKTLISYSIAIELCNKYNNQILFIAPKINLMEQTLNTFKNSKPQKIHKNTPYDKNHPILISTIQTASRRDLNPDVIIIDEIHYGFDGKMIENLIKDKPNIRIIGLSATPYDRNGRLLQGFDLVINKYDMKYMIENEYLVPLESYVLVRQNLKNVKLTAGDYNLSQLSKVVSNNNTILEIIRTSKEFIEKSKKTIVFAVDINHCELLTEAFKNEGFNAKSLHSNNDRDEFETIENLKKGYSKVLVSGGMAGDNAHFTQTFISSQNNILTRGSVGVSFNSDDLKVDTYRASGAGGQHINTTDSAVRITHLPTGVVVASQAQRSQLKNRDQAMSMLKAKLYQLEVEKQEQEAASLRGEQKEIGWGSQIRSYVFHPYSMVKDHRTNYETGNIQAVMDGELDGFIDAFLKMQLNENNPQK